MISIRKALLDDLPSLAILIEQLGYKIHLSTLKDNLSSYTQEPDRSLLVAESQERVVGCIALDMAQTFHREGKHMRVVSLVVDQACRRQGIGRRLLHAAEAMAKEQGCWVIEVTSSLRRQKEGTHDFYLNHGFVKDGSQYFHKLIEEASGGLRAR